MIDLSPLDPFPMETYALGKILYTFLDAHNGNRDLPEYRLLQQRIHSHQRLHGISSLIDPGVDVGDESLCFVARDDELAFVEGDAQILKAAVPEVVDQFLELLDHPFGFELCKQVESGWDPVSGCEVREQSRKAVLAYLFGYPMHGKYKNRIELNLKLDHPIDGADLNFAMIHPLPQIGEPT